MSEAREIQRLKSLAADHYRTARRLSRLLVQADMTIEQMRKECQCAASQQ